MSFTTILMLAVGLAMDATAVSATRGIAAKRLQPSNFVLVALLFGGFQALMPVVGWLLGTAVGPVVQQWDHWIAFVLLGFLGLKMLWEARSAGDDEAVEAANVFGLKVMLTLAFATSIDALAVGVTLPMLDAPFALSIATIGVTTALLSALGLAVGRRFGSMLGKRLDVVGGLVLIGLGTKILLEHLLAPAA